MLRLQDFLVNSALRQVQKTALVSGQDRVSYAALASRSLQLSWALRRRGVLPGDRVLIFSGNTVATAVSFWGIVAAGSVAVPISPSTNAERLAWLIEHCDASAVITEHGLLPVWRGAAPATARLKTTLVADLIDNADLAGVVDLAAALSEETGEAPPPCSLGDADLAAVIYTSGSTGRPKGVMLSHRNMISATESICEYLSLREHDVIHGIMPMSFDYGLYQLLLSVRQGARLVLAPPFTLPGQVLKQAAAEGVTFFPGIPTVFAMLAQLTDVSSWDLSGVRAVTSTAARLTNRHIATIRCMFPNARIYSMYGVTECKRCTYLPPEDLTRKPESVGIAIPGTELWLVDEHDRRLGANQVGQLVIKGPTVMQGYWGDREATSRRLKPGREPGELVLYTGDLCRLDDEGYLYFVARMDDVIKSRGEKVAPHEVEMVLGAIPGVRETVVVGVPDELLGHAVKAYVVVDPGAAVSETDILRECRRKLEAVKVPTMIAMVASLPKTANGKVDKLALEQQ
jgi:amino acid adenylation domain-containing protein